MTIQRKTHALLIALLTLCASGGFARAGDVLKVPIYDTTRAPLVIVQDGGVTGIYPEMFREILNRAGINFQFVPAPAMRRRVLFENGEYLLSCCGNPAWRNRPLETAVQLFSDQFFVSRDVFVFPRGGRFAINSMQDLADKSVGTVLGFDYQGSEWFGTRLDFKNEVNVLRRLSEGGLDVAIVNREVFKAFGQADRLEEGPIHDEASLHIRIHRSRADLLPAINSAIADFIRDGTRDAIHHRFIENSAGVTQVETAAAMIRQDAPIR